MMSSDDFQPIARAMASERSCYVAPESRLSRSLAGGAEPGECGHGRSRVCGSLVRGPVCLHERRLRAFGCQVTVVHCGKIPDRFVRLHFFLPFVIGDTKACCILLRRRSPQHPEDGC